MNTETEQLSEALGHFKDWSNYLLVTTVAALGWVATQPVIASGSWLKATIACFGGSIAFAIFTLALIPIVAESISSAHTSFSVAFP